MVSDKELFIHKMLQQQQQSQNKPVLKSDGNFEALFYFPEKS